MDNQLVSKFLDIISQNNKITIGVGKNVSYDDMAAALSMYLSLKQIKKDTVIASNATPLVEHASLVGIDNVKKQLESDNGDLIVSFPYREGEIEKVSYTLDNGFLNIVVKAGPTGMNFIEKDVKFSRAGSAPQVLIVVGTPNLSDLGTIFNAEALKDTLLINIDNKQENQGFGDVALISPQASTVSELMAKIINELGVTPDADIAQNILNGITVGSNNFQNPNTTFDAFDTATAMMKIGAKRQPINQSQDQKQNEERVSSFMPEQMISRSPVTNQQTRYAQPQTPSAGVSQQMQRPAQRPIRMPRPQPYMSNPQGYPTQNMPSQMPNAAPNYGISQQQYQQQIRSQLNQNPNVTDPVNQPNVSDQTPVQKPTDQAPSDWLTPKVFKGSTDIQQ